MGLIKCDHKLTLTTDVNCVLPEICFCHVTLNLALQTGLFHAGSAEEQSIEAGEDRRKKPFAGIIFKNYLLGYLWLLQKEIIGIQ